MSLMSRCDVLNREGVGALSKMSYFIAPCLIMSELTLSSRSDFLFVSFDASESSTNWKFGFARLSVL